ncbi:MAG: 16S rRNA (uracil(1498)-N(3))-methyltransferase [Flavobacteriia bacterium]
MHLFYDPTIGVESDTHQLSEEESKHACRVLRLKIGDVFQLLDGKGGIYNCRICDDNPKKCKVKIEKREFHPAPPYQIHIAIAPTKNMDRIEWFAEKATEIGLTDLTLITGKNSERKEVKLERIEKILVSAMKQSKQLYLPRLHPVTAVRTFISEYPNGMIAHCMDEDKSRISTSFNLKDCPILIGPEGDFTEDEVTMALSNGYKTVTLGSNRLRTETAGLYACMQMKLMTE